MTGSDKDESQLELARLLDDLGRVEPAVASEEAEQEREARVAERLDGQLAALVRRRRNLRWVGWLSAAAFVLLGLGLVRAPGSPRLLIEHELQKKPPVALLPPPVPSQAPAPAESAAAPRHARPPAQVTNTAAERVAAEPEASASSAPTSTLAEENALFKQAVDAGRQGDVVRALAVFDRLLTEHPASPLAQGALVKKIALLRGTGRGGDAAQAARRYLELYPTGFGVDEARAAIAAPSSSDIPLGAPP